MRSATHSWHWPGKRWRAIFCSEGLPNSSESDNLFTSLQIQLFQHFLEATPGDRLRRHFRRAPVEGQVEDVDRLDPGRPLTSGSHVGHMLLLALEAAGHLHQRQQSRSVRAVLDADV